MKFRIYQIKDIENTSYAFRSYDPEKFNCADYECVYEDDVVVAADKSHLEICEDLFYIFNKRRPRNFTGHALSMSDIIELTRPGRSKFYYCDMCGFQRLPYERFD